METSFLPIRVIDDIRGQKAKAETPTNQQLQAEYRAFLETHCVVFDQRYWWD
jgi:hypothetical protein